MTRSAAAAAAAAGTTSFWVLVSGDPLHLHRSRDPVRRPGGLSERVSRQKRYLSHPVPFLRLQAFHSPPVRGLNSSVTFFPPQSNAVPPPLVLSLSLLPTLSWLPPYISTDDAVAAEALFLNNVAISVF